MFVFTLAIFVVLVAIPVDGGVACCYPAQMQGVRYYVNQKQARYFAADYERGYIFQTLEPGGPNFTIYDLNNQKSYRIRGEACSEHPMIAPGLFDPCLATENMIQRDAFLGTGDQTIDVNFYDYQVGSYSVFKAVQFREAGCVPVATQTSVGRLRLTTVYAFVVTEIRNPEVFSALENCNVEVRGGGEQEGGSSDDSSNSSE